MSILIALLHVVSLAFFIFLAFSLRFSHVLDTNMLVYIKNARKNVRKMHENCPTREKYYTIRWVKTRASCVFLAFFPHLSRVFADKPYKNGNPMHSVLWYLIDESYKITLSYFRVCSLILRAPPSRYARAEQVKGYGGGGGVVRRGLGGGG